MIKQLEYTRFRGHEGKYTFGPGRNYIKGPNESGKSTIKEAIAFTWMGTDSAGTKNPDHLITVNENTSEVRLTTPKSTIARRKKRGATAEIKIVREGIPDVKISQTDLMNQLGISHEVFMSSWSVGYFMNLKPDTRLKVLGEIARIDRKQLLSTLVDMNLVPGQLKFTNPKIDADVVAGLRRTEQNKRQAQEAVLKTLQAQYNELPASVNEVNQDDLNGHIALLDEQLQAHQIYKQQLPRWKAENEKRSTAAENVSKLEAQLAEVTAAYQSATLDISSIQAIKEKAEGCLRTDGAAKEEALAGRKTVEMSLPAKPNIKSGVCPSCGTDVPEDRVEAMMKPYNEEVDKYNKHARAVADWNKKIEDRVLEFDKAIESHKARIADCNMQIKNVEFKISTYKSDGIKLKTQIEQLSNIPQDLLPAPVAPEGDEKELSHKRDTLKNELHTYNLFKTKKARLESDLKDTQQSIVAHTEKAQSYAIVETALLKLPELETEETLKKIAVPGVLMSLTEGELVVTDSSGVDYRCLSDGRRMKIDLALCLAIKKAEPRCPDWLFVDNADLMDEDVFVPDGVQVFVAQVDPKVKEVQVVSL